MKFSEAFNQTLEHFNLNARAVAQTAGVREATVSEFRRGIKEIHTDNLERLIAALPTDARQFLFCRLMAGQLDSGGIATLLNAIAMQIKDEHSGNTQFPQSNLANTALSLR